MKKSSPIKLVHHGAAATSSSKILAWLPLPDAGSDKSSDDVSNIPSLVYGSHAVINIARPVSVKLQSNDKTAENRHICWDVQETLRTVCSYSTSPNEAAPTITTLTRLEPVGLGMNLDNNTKIPSLACGFSNGSVSVWNKLKSKGGWEEVVLFDAIAAKQQQDIYQEAPRSLTDLKGVLCRNIKSNRNQNLLFLASCSSAGVMCYTYDIASSNTTLSIGQVTHHTAYALHWESLSEDTLLLLVGTAAPRHNKILIYSVCVSQALQNSTISLAFHFCGALTGHEDWVTCFAWQPLLSSDNYMLASGSQDFKIRLWKMTTSTATTTNVNTGAIVEESNSFQVEVDSDDDKQNVDKEDDEYEEHESRMEILWRANGKSMRTSVSLEALLLGHEGPVTAVQWYNPFNKHGTSKEPLVLLSSSMDRSILLWSPSEDDGIWAPISRVGSAGGILGGSIGSTLLGYVNVQTMLPQTENCSGTHWLVGHAYGGALHMWHRDVKQLTMSQYKHQHWKATNSIGGHFKSVTDICWESTFGEYLLSVSADQTCRLRAPLECSDSADKSAIWVELARPQVHGYDLSAVTSLSSQNHRHWLVSGADEKEIRILDAPMTTLRMLKAVSLATLGGQENSKENLDEDPASDKIERVQRAYIPSLGLSNKASAADGAEEDAQDVEDGFVQQKTVALPSERDLGALSLWLETRKLFGHNTEIYRLTSTLEAKTAFDSMEQQEDVPVLVASTAKARDIDDAAIRIWNPNSGECIQILSGGHKATCAALSFSSDGKYLASGGKDRRLCLWKKMVPNLGEHHPSFTLAAAKDSAHKRIIWSVHFCPFNSSVLASGSRDGNIKVWVVEDVIEGLAVGMNQMFSFAPATQSPAKKPDAVTALAFAPVPLPQKNSALLALGFECGLIELWSVPLFSEDVAAPFLLHSFAPNLCHVATVTKLAWRPMRNNEERLTLASGSADNGCRIFEILPSELSF